MNLFAKIHTILSLKVHGLFEYMKSSIKNLNF